MKEYETIDKPESIPMKAVSRALGIMAIIGVAMIGGYFILLYSFSSLELFVYL